MTNKEITKYMIKIVFTIDGLNQYDDVIDEGYLSSHITVKVNGLGELGQILEHIENAIKGT
jgi:hypothetical protein